MANRRNDAEEPGFLSRLGEVLTTDYLGTRGAAEPYLRKTYDGLTGGAWSAATDMVGATTPEDRAKSDAEWPKVAAAGSGTGDALLGLAMPGGLAAKAAVGAGKTVAGMGSDGDDKAPAPAKPPQQPAQPAGLVTQHLPGGQTLQTPIAAGVEQKTSGGSTTREKRVVSAQEMVNQGELANLTDEAADLGRQRGEIAQAVATAEAEGAEKAADIRAKHNERLIEVEKAANAEIQRRIGKATEAEETHKRALSDYDNAEKNFYARMDTKERVTNGVSILLGVLGGLKDGSNVGVERIKSAIDRDQARAREILSIREKMLDRAKGDVREARQNLRDDIDMLDIRKAAALEAAADEAIARGKRLGIPDKQLMALEGVVALKREAANTKQKWLESTSEQVKSTATWSKITTPGGPGDPNDKRPNASEGDLEKVNVIKSANDDINRLKEIIQTNPAAWREFQQNNVAWKRKDAAGSIQGIKQLRGGLQALNLADVTPDQGLTSPEAKELHQINERLKTANAKARGGAVTAADADAAEREQGLAAMGKAEDALKFYSTIQGRYNRGLQTIVANRKINLPPDAVPQQAPAAQPARQPPKEGEIRTLSTGRRAIFKEGTWLPAP